MPDSKVDTRTMSPQEKAKHLLSLPCKVPSDNSPELWKKCLETAEYNARMQGIVHLFRIAQEKRDSAESLALEIPEGREHDISRYTQNGSFDTMRFIADKKHYKTTWDGHILSAEDIQTAKSELAKGTPKAEIHDIIRRQQRERIMQQTEKQAAAINAQLGMINQPFCKHCMNRGYTAVVENGLYITFRICGCTLRRERAAEERRKAELEEKKNKKRGGKNNGTV